MAKTPIKSLGYKNFKEILEEWSGNLFSHFLAEKFNKTLHAKGINDLDISFL
jgi:hypothetical protein